MTIGTCRVEQTEADLAAAVLLDKRIRTAMCGQQIVPLKGMTEATIDVMLADRGDVALMKRCRRLVAPLIATRHLHLLLANAYKARVEDMGISACAIGTPAVQVIVPHCVFSNGLEHKAPMTVDGNCLKPDISGPLTYKEHDAALGKTGLVWTCCPPSWPGDSSWDARQTHIVQRDRINRTDWESHGLVIYQLSSMYEGSSFDFYISKDNYTLEKCPGYYPGKQGFLTRLIDKRKVSLSGNGTKMDRSLTVHFVGLEQMSERHYFEVSFDEEGRVSKISARPICYNISGSEEDKARIERSYGPNDKWDAALERQGPEMVVQVFKPGEEPPSAERFNPETTAVYNGWKRHCAEEGHNNRPETERELGEMFECWFRGMLHKPVDFGKTLEHMLKSKAPSNVLVPKD